jgi:5-amino-6-(5-phosphoribosylamino)uracil reductase
MLVHVSAAMSIDGYIDDREPSRLVLSSPEDLADMHATRSHYDAILVGAQTVRSDDPALLLRDAELIERRIEDGRTPQLMRVTLTHSGNLDPSARFFDGNARTVVLASRERASELSVRLHGRAEVVALGGFDPPAILVALEALGVSSLFVEGGTRVLTAFLAGGTFDRLRLAIAPFFVGNTRAPRLVSAATFLNDREHRLSLRSVRALGDTAVLDYERVPG